MNRRGFLRVAASAGISMTAACLGSDSDEYATIQRLVLINDRDDPVTTELKIERDDTDEIVHEGSYEIEAGLDGLAVDCVWPDEPLHIMTRPESDDEWNSFTTTDKEDCLIVYSETHDSGTSYFTSNEECPVRSPDCHTDVGSS